MRKVALHAAGAVVMCWRVTQQRNGRAVVVTGATTDAAPAEFVRQFAAAGGVVALGRLLPRSPVAVSALLVFADVAPDFITHELYTPCVLIAFSRFGAEATADGLDKLRALVDLQPALLAAFQANARVLGAAALALLAAAAGFDGSAALRTKAAALLNVLVGLETYRRVGPDPPRISGEDVMARFDAEGDFDNGVTDWRALGISVLPSLLSQDACLSPLFRMWLVTHDDDANNENAYGLLISSMLFAACSRRPPRVDMVSQMATLVMAGEAAGKARCNAGGAPFLLQRRASQLGRTSEALLRLLIAGSPVETAAVVHGVLLMQNYGPAVLAAVCDGSRSGRAATAVLALMDAQESVDLARASEACEDAAFAESQELLLRQLGRSTSLLDAKAHSAATSAPHRTAMRRAVTCAVALSTTNWDELSEEEQSRAVAPDVLKALTERGFATQVGTFSETAESTPTLYICQTMGLHFMTAMPEAVAVLLDARDVPLVPTGLLLQFLAQAAGAHACAAADAELECEESLLEDFAREGTAECVLDLPLSGAAARLADGFTLRERDAGVLAKLWAELRAPGAPPPALVDALQWRFEPQGPVDDDVRLDLASADGGVNCEGLLFMMHTQLRARGCRARGSTRPRRRHAFTGCPSSAATWTLCWRRRQRWWTRYGSCRRRRRRTTAPAASCAS